MGYHRGARTISIVLAAGLVAFEAGLALSGASVGIPGVFLVHFTDSGGSVGTSSGGESSIAKLAPAASTPKSARLASLDRAAAASAPEARDTAAAADTPSQQASAPAASKAPGVPPQLDLPVAGSLPPQIDLPSPDAAQDADEAADASVPPAQHMASMAGSGSPAGDTNVAGQAAPAPASASRMDQRAPAKRTASLDVDTDAAVADAVNSPHPKNDVAGAPGGEENLPWDDILPEPRPATADLGDAAEPTSSPSQTIADSQAASWVKTKASPLAGGVDDRGRPLYRFEVWLDPPADIKQKLVAVAYDFDAPSADPPTQESHDGQSGFKVRFGGLACADHIVLTLKYNDGRTEQVAVDGCKLPG